ncbi:MAG: response regulator transcription factor [Patescibacteria group bacterium]|jgi:DNA-binding response OmpR family regulator
MKILIVEDEEKLNHAIVSGLKSRGFAVDSAYDGEEGERLAREYAYDVVVTDIMMPKRDGVTLCKNLRDHGVTTPVLFLTARGALEDKITGLDIGADDYMVKPFSFEEFVARLRALARRSSHVIIGDTLALDGLILDTRTQEVTADGNRIVLTLREYGLLEYLLRNQGAVVTREDILSQVWDRFFDSFSNVVDVHMKNLRKKLPPSYAKRLETVWGKGYRLA